jgi:hypothetical protein
LFLSGFVLDLFLFNGFVLLFDWLKVFNRVF